MRKKSKSSFHVASEDKYSVDDDEVDHDKLDDFVEEEISDRASDRYMTTPTGKEPLVEKSVKPESSAKNVSNHDEKRKVDSSLKNEPPKNQKMVNSSSEKPPSSIIMDEVD